MIGAFDQPSGKNPKQSSPRMLLQSIERHLSETAPVADQCVHEAQQLVFDAWEAPTDQKARRLFERALRLDPTNVDALLQVAVYSRVEGEQEIEFLRKIVATAEKKLGPKLFKECAGAFWGFIETRPYMRARQRLAEALRASGRLAEAVSEYQAMLELNPNDNQGVRYTLLPSLLMLNRLDDARKLFAQYKAEWKFNTVFAWARVLERFLAGDLPAATRALRAARKQNPHTQAYVTSLRKIPRQLPEAYAPGSIDEAVCFADVLHAAWQQHPAALEWLDAQS